MLTQIGETFPGRVAASLLHAIDLPELVAPNQHDYEALAIELASDKGKLAAIRQKLSDNRLTTTLFDTELFTRHIEAAYKAMHERHQAGLAADLIQNGALDLGMLRVSEVDIDQPELCSLLVQGPRVNRLPEFVWRE